MPISTKMADIKSPEERSRNMAKIRGKDTKPEEYVRKKLYAMGYRYRKNCAAVFGHPDVWIPKYNVAVFVHGCYWHRHSGCKYAYMPKSNEAFWKEKFNKNVERDRAVLCELKEREIRILVIWECTVKRMMKSSDYENTMLNKIDCFFESQESYMEL